MSFALLNPWALWLAALAAPVALLYLRRVPDRRVDTSTGFLWAEVFSAAERSAAWKGRRRQVSLALALGILAALVAAAAGPDLRPPRRTVLVLDNAGGMGTVGAAFDAVKRQGLAHLEAMGQRDEAAVVATTGALRVRCGMTASQAALRRAVDGLALGGGGEGLDSAVELARRIVAEEPHARIVVISDCEQDHARTRQASVEWSGPSGPAPSPAGAAPWSLLGIVAAALLAAEWALYQRRWVE